MSDLTAIIWDFDGTLVDTRDKNLAVTRILVERVTERPAGDIAALASRAGYESALHRHQHWHDFYRVELGLDDEELVEAAGLWLEAQANDRTEASCFAGVPEVLAHFRHLPHGIVSLNAGDNIARIVAELEIDAYFGAILGFEAVPLERRKPEPDALLLCIERLGALAPGTVVYVGDHETDALCAARAHAALSDRGQPVRVISIAADFGSTGSVQRWQTRPDHVAASAHEVIEILDGLGNG